MSETEKTAAPSAQSPTLTIWQAIPKITGEVAPIAKTRRNVQQSYNFRGIDDVYAALNLLLAKYGVSVLPEILDSHHEVCGTTKSGSNMYRHTIKVRYHLVASDQSEVTADTEGEGMDTGDKATPKAFSTAYKTMAFQVFCIPTDSKVDSENDSPEVVAGNGHGISAEDLARIQADTCAELKAKLEKAATAAELQEVAAEVAKAAGEKRLSEGQRLELSPVWAARKKALTPSRVTQ